MAFHLCFGERKPSASSTPLRHSPVAISSERDSVNLVLFQHSRACSRTDDCRNGKRRRDERQGAHRVARLRQRFAGSGGLLFRLSGIARRLDGIRQLRNIEAFRCALNARRIDKQKRRLGVGGKLVISRLGRCLRKLDVVGQLDRCEVGDRRQIGRASCRERV